MRRTLVALCIFTIIMNAAVAEEFDLIDAAVSPCRAQSLLRRMKASDVMRINEGGKNGQTRNY